VRCYLNQLAVAGLNEHVPRYDQHARARSVGGGNSGEQINEVPPNKEGVQKSVMEWNAELQSRTYMSVAERVVARPASRYLSGHQ